MRIVRTAVALSIVCGIGAQYGWTNALAAAILLAFAIWLFRVARTAPTVFRSNGCRRSHGTRRVADAMITIAAASSKSSGARNAALEACSILDDMVGDGKSWLRCLVAAAWIAFRLDGSARRREGSPAPNVAVERSPSSPQPINEELALRWTRELMAEYWKGFDKAVKGAEGPFRSKRRKFPSVEIDNYYFGSQAGRLPDWVEDALLGGKPPDNERPAGC